LGWVSRLAYPESRVPVRVLLNDAEIGVAVADQYREDLAAAGIGDGSGCYMFRFEIPAKIRQNDRYWLRFLADDYELDGSPLEVIEPAGDVYRLHRLNGAPWQPGTFEILPFGRSAEPALPMNSGLAVLNLTRPDPGPRTVIVAGHARSGTSMAARALHALGLPMGLRDPMPTNCEDSAIVEILQTAIDRPPLNTEMLDEVIAQRNAAHVNWGFKAPAAMESMPYLLRHTRNPHVVLVFRDALAICLRERLAVNSDPWLAFESVLAYQARMLKFLRNTDVPCFLVSYEKAILNAPWFCETLAMFAGLTASHPRVAAAVRQINPNQRDYLEDVAVIRQLLTRTAGS
jgi:hypothetical protein